MRRPGCIAAGIAVSCQAFGSCGTAPLFRVSLSLHSSASVSANPKQTWTLPPPSLQDPLPRHLNFAHQRPTGGVNQGEQTTESIVDRLLGLGQRIDHRTNPVPSAIDVSDTDHLTTGPETRAESPAGREGSAMSVTPFGRACRWRATGRFPRLRRWERGSSDVCRAIRADDIESPMAGIRAAGRASAPRRPRGSSQGRTCPRPPGRRRNRPPPPRTRRAHSRSGASRPNR